MKNLVKVSGFLAAVLCPQLCFAVSSAELYTSKSYGYGRFEARTRWAPGDGVISAFFLWKDGSEVKGAYWNELDFEKVGADCHFQTNAIYGMPDPNHPNDGVPNHTMQHTAQPDPCGTYHTYAYEWTPDAIAWLVDGTVIRRETGDMAKAFADNAKTGMQFHFNLWPGDSTFGGNLKESSLPVHQYIDWVQYSTYDNGTFTLSWREDFTGTTLPTGWLTGSWMSPKGKSTHDPENVNLLNGFAVLSMTLDNALGPAGAMPGDSGGASASGGSTGTGAGGSATSGGSANGSAGTPGSGGSGEVPGGGGSPAAAAGSPGAPGASGSPGSSNGVGGGAPAASGGSSNPGGPSNGAGSSSSDSGCSFAPSPTRNGLWWALLVPALTVLRRRVRRSSAA